MPTKLSVSQLAKLGDPDVTGRHLDWFFGLTREERDRLAAGEYQLNPAPAPIVPKPEKFDLFLDLGIIEVPPNYKSKHQLENFLRTSQNVISSYPSTFTDVSFRRPTTLLCPGRRLRVRAFKQVEMGAASSIERIRFLESHRCVFTGAQGLTLVIEQLRDKLCGERRYLSYDYAGALPEEGGDEKVPGVHCNSGRLHLILTSFKKPMWWHHFFCFTDVE